MASQSKVTALVMAGKGPGALGEAAGAAHNAVVPVNSGPGIARVVDPVAACGELGEKLAARISRRFGYGLAAFVSSDRHCAIHLDTGRMPKLAVKILGRRECDRGAGPA